MIKINRIEPFTCEAFDPNNNSLGFLNIYEFLDLRLQISKEKVKGYYMKFNNEIIEITINGSISSYPNGFFNLKYSQ